MADRKLIVQIVGDDKSLLNSFKRSEAAATTFGAKMKGVSGQVLATNTALGRFKLDRTGFLSGAAGGAGVLAASTALSELFSVMRTGVEISSNLNEQTSKSRVVFGDSSRAIEAWAKTASRSFGIARDEAIGFASTFGALFVNLGQAPAKAAAMSKALVQLAADLASFNNTSPEDALAALQSGLAGEIEPLRRYQVFLNAAAVANEALRETGKKSTQQLTDADKVLARYALIMRQTVRQQGDFSRTQGGLANSSRQLSAEFRDLEGNLGRLARGPLTVLVHGLNDVASAALTAIDALDKLAHVKIPTIKIPFTTVKVPGTGGTVGDALGAAAGFAADEFKSAVTPLPVKIANAIKDAVTGTNRDTDKAVAAQTAKLFDPANLPLTQQGLAAAQKRLQKLMRTGVAGGTGGLEGGLAGVQPRVQPLTAEQRNRFFDAAIGRAQDLVQDQANIQGQIASLQQIAAKIQSRIAATKDVTRKLTLEGTLRGVLREIAADREQLAADLKQASADSWQKLQDSLQFDLERAEATVGFADDLTALLRIQAAIKKRIAEEGRTTELLRQLFENRQQIADTQRAQRSARQFRALGLGPTGEDIVPGIKNLQKQFSQLTQRINLGAPISDKLKTQLQGVRKIINDELGGATKDVRARINELFQTIRDGFDKQTGPLTKTHALDTSKIIENLGLDRDTANQIRQRLSKFNTAGLALGAPSFSTSGALAGAAAGAATIVIQHETKLDGRVIERSTTKHQQTRSVRNPSSRRGRR